MKYLFITIGLLLGTVCKGQTTQQGKPFFSKNFNWTIIVPTGLNELSAEEVAKLRERGKVAIEKTSGAEIEDHAKVIFSYKPDPVNYFEANEQPYNVAKDGDYAQSCKEVNDIVFNTFKNQFPPGTKLDSVINTEVIDNLVFQKFFTRITFPNNKIMNLYMFSRLFGKRELTISIAYIDDQKGKSYLSAFRSSRFSK